MNPVSPTLPSRRTVAGISLLIVLVTFAVYWPARHFEFVGYDDPFFGLHNPFVSGGLTARGLVWSLFTSYFEYWHPVTWWSHMLDCELFGLRAGWHHLTSVAFHAANSALVFLALRQLTGKTARSAFVGALFALHPLHVESAAWIAERKDVLSTFFWLLTIYAYGRYVAASTTDARKSKIWFLYALGCFTLGLMSKPMVVTLPFVLLLLDYWPLDRIRWPAAGEGWGPALREIANLTREKIAFFVLTFLSCLITYGGVKAGDHLISTEAVGLGLRLGNIPISYVRYLGKTFWPEDLMVLYPLPPSWPLGLVVGSLVLVLLITAFVLMKGGKAGYLIFGWFMLLGTLLPTIGILTVGRQAIADRYMYMPSIGLFVALVWGIADFAKPWKSRVPLLSLAGAAVLASCAVLTRAQLAHWRNSITLWSHCLAIKPDHLEAQYNRGVALFEAGRYDEAAEDYRRTLKIKPDHVEGNMNMGVILAITGHPKEATNYYARSLAVKPRYGKALLNMALAQVELGDYTNALNYCDKALEANPYDAGAITCKAHALSALGHADDALPLYVKAIGMDASYPEARYQYGLELLKQGLVNEALASLGLAVRMNPLRADWRVAYGEALASMGNQREAISQYREALKTKPDLGPAMDRLAWLLATSKDTHLRNAAEAVQLAEKANVKPEPAPATFIATLAAAYAEAGDFEKAAATAQKAIDLAAVQNDSVLLERSRKMLEQFKQRQAYRE